jgi:hypothetical protein
LVHILVIQFLVWRATVRLAITFVLAFQEIMAQVGHWHMTTRQGSHERGECHISTFDHDLQKQYSHTLNLAPFVTDFCCYYVMKPNQLEPQPSNVPTHWRVMKHPTSMLTFEHSLVGVLTPKWPRVLLRSPVWEKLLRLDSPMLSWIFIIQFET